jgi:hypothetical protein
MCCSGKKNMVLSNFMYFGYFIIKVEKHCYMVLQKSYNYLSGNLHLFGCTYNFIHGGQPRNPLAYHSNFFTGTVVVITVIEIVTYALQSSKTNFSESANGTEVILAINITYIMCPNYTLYCSSNPVLHTDMTVDKDVMRRLTRPQETCTSQHEEGATTTTLSPTCFRLYILAFRSDGILITNCWIGSKVCLLTINTGASVTTARPAREEAASSIHSTDGVWEDSPCLERGSGGADSGVEFTTNLGLCCKGRRQVRPRADILQAYNMAVNLKHHMLQLGQEEVLLWHA